MDKAIAAAQEKRVEDLFNEALEVTGLVERYEWEFLYADWDEDDQDGDDIPTIYTTAAKTTAQWQYSRARIVWYLGKIASISDLQLFRIIVHEIAHVLLNPLDSLLSFEYDDDSVRNEYATENVARAILVASGRSPIDC